VIDDSSGSELCTTFWRGEEECGHQLELDKWYGHIGGSDFISPAEAR
jgi:hypothetical protein